MDEGVDMDKEVAALAGEVAVDTDEAVLAPVAVDEAQVDAVVLALGADLAVVLVLAQDAESVLVQAEVVVSESAVAQDVDLDAVLGVDWDRGVGLVQTLEVFRRHLREQFVLRKNIHFPIRQPSQA